MTLQAQLRSGAQGRDGTRSCSHLYNQINLFLLWAQIENVLGRYSTSESDFFFFFFNLYGGWAATRRYTAGLGDRSYKCHVSGTKRGSIRLFIAANVSGWGQKRQVLDADINVIVRFAKLYVHIFYIMDGLHFHVHGSLENGQFCHLKDASCHMLLDFLLKQTSPTLAHFTFITNANRQVEAEEEREMWQMDDLSFNRNCQISRRDGGSIFSRSYLAKFPLLVLLTPTC